MPDRRRKAVRVDEQIGDVLDAFAGQRGTKRQHLASAGLFFYFSVPEDVRAFVDSFYESWRNSRGPHFHADPQGDESPIVGLDFPSHGMPQVFYELLVRHLKDAAKDLSEPFPPEASADHEPPAPPAPAPAKPAPKPALKRPRR